MKILIFFLLLVQLSFAELNQKQNSVIDTQTRLEWQDTKDNMKKEKKWRESEIYCKNLDLDEHYDWRLASLKELKNLADKSKDKEIFHYDAQDSYWSLDEDEDIISAYQVYMPNVHVSKWDKCDTLHVRCVRYH